MSIKTTRRGLFALATAAVGAGTLVAAKPAETPVAEYPSAQEVSQFRVLVKGYISLEGGVPDHWVVDVSPNEGGSWVIAVERDGPRRPFSYSLYDPEVGLTNGKAAALGAWAAHQDAMERAKEAQQW